jgi:hypothetical protein
MLLTDFFNSLEDDSYAKLTSASPITESKRTASQDNLVRKKANNNKKVFNPVFLKKGNSMVLPRKNT